MFRVIALYDLIYYYYFPVLEKIKSVLHLVFYQMRGLDSAWQVKRHVTSS